MKKALSSEWFFEPNATLFNWVFDVIDNAPTVNYSFYQKEAYRRGLEVGKKIGARAERTMTIAYLEGKTIEEDQIEKMFKNGEIEAIPYLGETREEEPDER